MSTILGAKINKIRTQKGMTLEELAVKVGTDKSYIWSVENGRIKQPSAEVIEKIAKSLGVLSSDLLGARPRSLEAEKERLFRNFENLTDKDRKTIKEMIERFQKKA